MSMPPECRKQASRSASRRASQIWSLGNMLSEPSPPSRHHSRLAAGLYSSPSVWSSLKTATRCSVGSSGCGAMPRYTHPPGVRAIAQGGCRYTSSPPSSAAASSSSSGRPKWWRITTVSAPGPSTAKLANFSSSVASVNGSSLSTRTVMPAIS